MEPSQPRGFAASMAVNISVVFSMLLGFLPLQCVIREHHIYINRYISRGKSLHCFFKSCSGVIRAQYLQKLGGHARLVDGGAFLIDHYAILNECSNWANGSRIK